MNQAAAVPVVPGREAPTKELCMLAGPKDCPACPCIFVYGCQATGKTTTVKAVLQHLKAPYAMVSCREAYTSRVLFERVLNHLSGDAPSPDNKYLGHGRCETLPQFVEKLRRLIDGKHGTNKCFIVLDDAAYLRRLPFNVFASFVELAHLVQRNVCVILISNCVWESFSRDTDCARPCLVYFPQYTKDEAIDILCQSRPPDADAEVFRSFAQLMWDVFNKPCRDISELRHLVQLTFPIYNKPIVEGKISKGNTGALYKHITPVLQKQLSKVYLRELSTADLEAMQNTSKSSDDSFAPKSHSTTYTSAELPYQAKLLVVAAFIASHNPPRYDVQLFVKRSSKTKKRRQASRKQASNALNSIHAPKPFPLDRLLAIFASISGEPVESTTDVFVQIRSLVMLHMLQQVSSRDTLSAPKFKCIVPREAAEALAKGVEFDLAAHLYDEYDNNS